LTNAKHETNTPGQYAERDEVCLAGIGRTVLSSDYIIYAASRFSVSKFSSVKRRMPVILIAVEMTGYVIGRPDGRDKA
jgi:hypothetical protein